MYSYGLTLCSWQVWEHGEVVSAGGVTDEEIVLAPEPLRVCQRSVAVSQAAHVRYRSG
jgi:hypothetical protein